MNNVFPVADLSITFPSILNLYSFFIGMQRCPFRIVQKLSDKHSLLARITASAFSRIPRTATAIMRVAMYEILYMPEIPKAAAINDAVEIAKKYEDEKVVSFVNGILGAFIREEFPDEVSQTSGTEQEEL